MRRTLYHLADCPELAEDLAQAGPDATKRFALDVLHQIGTGDRFAIAMSAENTYVTPTSACSRPYWSMRSCL
jgi:hypothetical protein